MNFAKWKTVCAKVEDGFFVAILLAESIRKY